MWGDDPEDYSKVHLDKYGVATPTLPTSEKIGDDWVADLDWVFMASSEYADACILTRVRYTGDGVRQCSDEIAELSKQVVETLWFRYQQNIVKNVHAVDPLDT